MASLTGLLRMILGSAKVKERIIGVLGAFLDDSGTHSASRVVAIGGLLGDHDLQREIDPFGLSNLAPIEPDPNLVGRSSERDLGINPSVFDFVDLFRRLVQRDQVAALRELAAWRQHDASDD